MSEQASIALPRIAFCITCKGRTQHLKETLPQNIADNAVYGNAVFVVLDYNSPDECADYIRTVHVHDLESGRLVYYKNPEPDKFHMAHAKNMAHRCGMREGATILVNLDADNFTTPDFASYIADQFKQETGCFLWARMIKGVLPRGINGRIAVTKHAFINAGGYDEKYDTWNHDDKDFNLRLRRLGYSGRQIHPRYLDAIRHTDRMRFKEYPHRLMETYNEPVDEYLMSSDMTIANYGKIGCGTVYRNFSEEAIELNPLPTRIFGIGMHKTATTSLHLAMKILNFDSAHWTNAHWAKAIWLEMKQWGRSLTLEKSYHLCDLPIPILFRELDKAYPNSKFILTMLDEEAWVEAARIHWSPRNRFRAAWDTDPFSHQIHQAIYGQRHFDREVFRARYRKHNVEVLQYFKDRRQDLLTMNMSGGAGWKELCAFVGKPVPDVPYPHGNPNGE